ncbi:hypothetical protein [Halomonas sp. KM-1]|uniref:homocitrate synthase/isopropylmalate synthase family protein n=1 Tax=Halomonas sp. KM-1 TaxID=590061 RepID=UPI0009FC2737|nr:hypothetical protein [Halomonas sp. KM-1]
MRHDIVLEDTTLRDGEQAPGVAFRKEIKIKIFNALIDAGVKWIEPGIPAMKGEEVSTIQEMLERKNEVNLIGWNRGIKEDICYSLDLGFNAIHIGLPTSDKHLKGSVGKSAEWLVGTAKELVKYAKDRGAFVSISAEDVGRTEIPFLQEYAIAVEEAGADRLRLSDTIGVLSPEEYGRRVEAVSKVSSIDTQCHCHNDFGLAVANTLAGLRAGAKYFHVCVNSMGERAGMPDLAQMTLALKFLYGRDVGIRTTHLKALSDLVSLASNQPLPAWQPVVGENVFAHESGIHVNGMLKDTSTFEPFPPEVVGNQRRYVIGKHSGRATLRNTLEEKGIIPRDDLLSMCLVKVREVSTYQGGALTPEQLSNIYKNLQDEAEATP